METAAGRVQSRLHERCGVSITYARGAASATLTATLDKKVLQVGSDRGGAKVVVSDAAFLVAAAALILSGGATEPAKGDTIAHAGATYTVLSPGGGEPPWQWADAHRVMMRVHTKLTS